MVANVTGDEIANDEGVQEMIVLYAEMAGEAREAIKAIDQIIQAERAKRERRMAEREMERVRTRERREQQRLERAQVQAQRGCCYLTTACCNYYGLADDCEYLNVLRQFRDHWLLKQPKGKQLVGEYYDRSPAVVAGIECRHDKEKIYQLLLQGIEMAVSLIHNKEMKKAAQFYENMSRSLGKLVLDH